MNITKEVLEIEVNLQSRINNLLSFLNIKADIKLGNIISLENTNIGYIEPHQLTINDNTYLFFNECQDVYINTLEQPISLIELENYIRKNL